LIVSWSVCFGSVPLGVSVTVFIPGPYTVEVRGTGLLGGGLALDEMLARLAAGPLKGRAPLATSEVLRIGRECAGARGGGGGQRGCIR
jgi:hypothetical protein